MKVVTTEEMREIDRRAKADGLKHAQMMEQAGRAVAEEIAARWEELAGVNILALVGPGTNGGDALVAARPRRERGANVSLYLWRRKVEDDENFRRNQELGISYLWTEQDPQLGGLKQRLSGAHIVIDGLLGTGITLPLRGRVVEILKLVAQEMEGRRFFLVAVDVPTGVEATTGAADAATPTADLSVTFAYPKRGQYLFPGAGYVGELVVADIGIPPNLADDVTVELLTRQHIAGLLPPRPMDAHKGTFGQALVVAGSANYTGAAYLAAAAATRVGAGLVTLALAGSLHPILASKLTEATYLLLPESLGALTPAGIDILTQRLPKYQALLLGPGLGQVEETLEFVYRLLGMEAKTSHPIGFRAPAPKREPESAAPLPPLVIDADGLNALARVKNWWTSLPEGSILTPHPGEMARLSDTTIQEVMRDRIGLTKRAALEWQQVVVLKGAYTLSADPQGEMVIGPFANPALATAGTGDVLAGASAGMLAQGLPPYQATQIGAYLHGLAGEMAKGVLGDAGVVAGDLLPLLPKAIRHLKKDA